MAHIDIIIYALIAVVLLARLWVVFGRRNDGDPQRPNPFAAPAPGLRDDEDGVVLGGRDRQNGTPSSPAFLAPASLLGALDAVKRLDPSFDERQVLQTARATFTTVVSAFAGGDLSGVERLLGPSVLAGFKAAVAARAAAGETLTSRIINIRDVETAAARVEDSRVFITVRFVSEQENILRDAAGKPVSGAPGKNEEITDLWTFMRDTKAPDPAWQLVETKS